MVKLAWESHDSAYELLHELATGNFTKLLDGQHNNEIMAVLQRWDLGAYYNVISNIDMRDNEAKVNGFSGRTFDWFPQAISDARLQAIRQTIPGGNFYKLHGEVLLHSLGILYGILRYLNEKIVWPARTKRKKVPFAQSAYDRIFDVQQLLRERAESMVEVLDDDNIGQLPEMPIAILFLLVAFFVFALTQ